MRGISAPLFRRSLLDSAKIGLRSIEGAPLGALPHNFILFYYSTIKKIMQGGMRFFSKISHSKFKKIKKTHKKFHEVATNLYFFI